MKATSLCPPLFKPHPPVVCPDLPREITADDVIALTLSIIRGRVFGRRSAEVQLLRLALRQQGFEICRVGECSR